MKSDNKTKKELIDELSGLRNKVSELESLLESKQGIEQIFFWLDSNFDKMLETVPIALCIFSSDMTQTLYVSSAYEKIFGRGREKLYMYAESWLDNIHPEDRSRVSNYVEECAGRGYEIEYRTIRPDGSIRWVKDRVSPVIDCGKEGSRVLKFIEDITENKQIEETLRDYFQRSVEIVNAIPSGLLIYQYKPDNEFSLIDGNPAAERMTGIAIDEWHKHKINDEWVKNLGLLDECVNVIKTGKTVEIDDLDYKDSRFEGNFRMRLFPLPGDQLGVAFENTTELKKSVEREAQAYALGRIEVVDAILHNIGNAINSVTTGIGTLQENISNNKLTRHIALLANAIKEHQEDFADYVKNDPQGQMVASFIIALAEDFGKQDKDMSRIVNRVRERAQHIADIIRMERVISGRGVYRKYISPKKSIEDTVNFFQESIKKRNIEAMIDCDNQGEICIQESQFHQMLVNLIKNSIEATDDLVARRRSPDYLSNMTSEEDEYNPTIKIKCSTEKSNFVFEISDNGIGIEKDKLEVIFRPGYTTKGSGSGLGLHSVANFVSGCGGHISALSDGIGKGATMRIKLPLSSVT